jgi:hypothetical protein
VIDSKEARELFVHVRDVKSEEEELIKYMRGTLRTPAQDTILSFLSEARKEEVANDGDNTQDAGSGGASDEAGNPAVEGVPRGEDASRPGAVPELRAERRTGTR